MYLTLIKEIKRNRGSAALCRCKCGTEVTISLWSFKSGHKKTCGSKECNSKLLSEARTGKPRLDMQGKKPHNWIDRTGMKHNKLTFEKHLGGTRWRCVCECGNSTEVLTTNLGKTVGCRACANRKDIAGEKIGLLTAVSSDSVVGGQPLWEFQCECGGKIQGTVREFHANWLRSCGCHDSTFGSWSSMMGRCYDPKNNRYRHYGGRGIKVCKRWHEFENFVKDMGERPKRFNLSRKKCEKDYGPSNCEWEHVSKNTADTYYGKPTKPGLKKGARTR